MTTDAVVPIVVASKRGTLWLEPLLSATVPLDAQLPDYDKCKLLSCPEGECAH